MPEVAHSGEDHGKTCLIGGINHHLVIHRPAGLNDAACTSFCSSQQPVREGEEGFGGDSTVLRARDIPASGYAGFFGLVRSHEGGFNPACLARADSSGHTILREDDGVGFDMLGDGHGKQHVADFGVAWVALGDHFEVICRDPAAVAILYQYSARNRTQGQAVGPVDLAGHW